MDESYDGSEVLDYAPGSATKAELGSAASVFKDMLGEMGIDPLDRSEWLRKFVERNRAWESRNGSFAFESR